MVLPVLVYTYYTRNLRIVRALLRYTTAVGETPLFPPLERGRRMIGRRDSQESEQNRILETVVSRRQIRQGLDGGGGSTRAGPQLQPRLRRK